MKNRTAPEIEQAVVELAIAQPAWGQVRVSNALRQCGLAIRPPACAACGSGTGTSSPWRSRTSTTAGPRTRSPQTNGTCERVHRTALDEFYRVAFRKKIYRGMEELQADLDVWFAENKDSRPHQGRWCFGKTPMQTFLGTIALAREKIRPP